MNFIIAYLRELIGENYNEKRGFNMGGWRGECIRFSDDMVVLAEGMEELRVQIFFQL